MTMAIAERLTGAYEQAQLDNLWSVLKDKFRTSPRRYNPAGLVEVTFNIPLDLFREECQRKMQEHVPWVDYTIITYSIKDCFDFFLGKRILSHGLCCAAEFKSPTNTAVSIYLMSHSSGEVGHEKFGLILPGVNYVPPVESVEEWKESGRIDYSEYEKWRELTDRFNPRGFSLV